MDEQDIKFMKAAIKLADKGRGFTEPNPMVGAVVVKGDKVISTGFHKAYGEAHAERMALIDCEAEGSTLYVTLEPCIHYGKTPPCADLIIDKKVKRVVVATTDPNPLMAGKGIKKLKDAGVEVDSGCLEKEAINMNRHYMKFIGSKRPYVLIKAGVSVDGKLTDYTQNPGWVTSEELREVSGSLRGDYSAILVGSKTLIKDDPLLTIRDKSWDGKKLWRVVLNGGNDISRDYRIFEQQERFPLIIFSKEGTEEKGKKCEHHYFIPTEDSFLKIEKVLEKLGKIGISSLMVEGGGGVIDSFIKSSLYDELMLFTAPKILGGVDSVQLYSSGSILKGVSDLKDWSLVTLESGYILRGYR